MNKYVFRRYNPDFKKFFQIEKRKIANALKKNAKIEHVGSTSIPNLGGKGIIDIAVGVSKSKFNKAKEKLILGGWEFREIASYPKRLFFRADYPYKNQKRRAHLHLVEYNKSEWKTMINFRNYLIKNKSAIKEYEKIKKLAVKKAKGDGKKYRQCKEGFINKILK